MTLPLSLAHPSRRSSTFEFCEEGSVTADLDLAVFCLFIQLRIARTVHRLTVKHAITVWGSASDLTSLSRLAAQAFLPRLRLRWTVPPSTPPPHVGARPSGSAFRTMAGEISYDGATLQFPNLVQHIASSRPLSRLTLRLSPPFPFPDSIRS